MLVTTTAAEISAYTLPNFIGSGSGMTPQEPLYSHDLAWGAVAALKRIVLQESLLNGSKHLTCMSPRCRDLLAFGLHGKSQQA